MRALAIVIAIAACSDHKPTHADAAPHDASIDTPVDAPYACGVSASCANGPSCGTSCCGEGEHCVAGTCMCGNLSSCTNGNTCQGAGFVGVCGSVCCGTTIGCPIGLR